ncbi:MAG: NAD-dependent epimerase/dehydratase family protein [Saprospiraceae bacterium]|nr:NAD-dependent epimerase/dehydratase family protein [Saprospiraceae bacterium]
MIKKEPILVTGGTGFLGSYILRYLVAQGFEQIRALHRKDCDYSLVEPVMNRIQWIECNLQDTEALYEAVNGSHRIIHAAALVSFDPRHDRTLLQINTEGTANVINIALASDVQKVVYVSSIAAIGRETNGQVITEETKWEESDWVNGYAKSKYLAELEVWRGSLEGLDTCIINPSVILGSGFWNKGSARIFHLVAKGFPVYPLGGTGFVDVRDVARAAIIGLNDRIKDRRIIISGENRSYREIMREIAQQLRMSEPKYGLNTLLQRLAVMWDWTNARLKKKSQLLTITSLRNASRTIHFENQRSLDLLELEYTPIADTIADTCLQLRESMQSHGKPRYLSLN